MLAIKRVFIATAPYLFGLLFGLYFFTFNITGIDLSYFPGDLGDARFVIYILEHAHQYFILDKVPTESYWSAPFMFPEKDVISYSVNLLGTFPIYSFFRLIGFNTFMSFLYWFITICILNYSCAYLFIKWLLKNKYAAVIGAFIFAFNIVLISQSFHAQTFPRFVVPLTLWAACLFIKRFSVRYFTLCLLLLVYQFYCGMYLGFMLFIPLSILLLFGILVQYKPFIKSISNLKSIGAYLGSILFSIILLLPIAIPYNERSKQVGLKTYHEIYESIPSIYSYLNSSWASTPWHFISTKFNDRFVNWWNHELFLGIMSYVAILVCILYLLKSYKKVFSNHIFSGLLISSIATFFLFFRIGSFSLYKYLMILPGFGSMRALQRIINVELIFVAVAVAVFYLLVSRLIKNQNLNALFFLFFFALILADNHFDGKMMSKTAISSALQRESYLEEKLSSLSYGQVFSYEPDTIINSPVDYHIDAMLVAQKLSLKTVNGYTATSPASYSSFWKNPKADNRKFWLNSFTINEEINVIN